VKNVLIYTYAQINEAIIFKTELETKEISEEKRPFAIVCFRIQGGKMLQQIRSEITPPFYQQNFTNDCTRFIAWYLRRVLRCDASSTKDHITDGADDKQIDAVVVDDDERRVLIIQGKFLDGTKVDGEPLREVLSAWTRLNDLGSLQKDCNEKPGKKLEAVRQAIDDEYDIEFELLTTGEITDSARADFKAFSTRLEETNDLPPIFKFVDTEVIQARLAEADALELPSLNHSIVVERDNTLYQRPRYLTRGGFRFRG
jgi:hypothetical protein